MVSSKDKCPWCDWNPFCKGSFGCDFKTLKFTKIEIIKRIKSEVDWVARNRRRLLGADDLKAPEQKEIIQGILDRTKGMEIMINVLKSEFQMADADIKPLFRDSKMAPTEKLKMMSRLHSLRRSLK